MRVVVISDTHGAHDQLGTLSGDVLVHCGDFCHGFRNDGAEIASIDEWFAAQEFERILCIGGNHDFEAQARHARGESVFRNAIYLEDSGHMFGGIRFYGSPWLPDLQGWAYHLSDSKRREKWARIPPDTEVLLTHTPPHGILDKPRSGRSIGCESLRSVVEALAPKAHCFGHVHASFGEECVNGVTFLNAAVIGANGRGAPYVLDL